MLLVEWFDTSGSNIGDVPVPNEPNDIVGTSCSGEPPPNTDGSAGAVLAVCPIGGNEKGEDPMELEVPNVKDGWLEIPLMAGTPKAAKTKG